MDILGFALFAKVLGEWVKGHLLVDAEGDAHEHVLRPLHHHPIDPQQVRPLQGLQAKKLAC